MCWRRLQWQGCNEGSQQGQLRLCHPGFQRAHINVHLALKAACRLLLQHGKHREQQRHLQRAFDIRSPLNSGLALLLQETP